MPRELEEIRLSPAQKTELLDLVSRGWPVAEAAIEVGAPPLAVTQTARKDHVFGQLLMDALELSTSQFEAILLEIAQNERTSAMARVSALKTLLEGRSARYKHFQAPDPGNNNIQSRFVNYPQLDS